MRVRHQRGSKAGAMLGVLCVAIALLWSSVTKVETRVYLMRGWFGVFSTGLDSLAEEPGRSIKLRPSGICPGRRRFRTLLEIMPPARAVRWSWPDNHKGE
jgi:hypothetical protein